MNRLLGLALMSWSIVILTACSFNGADEIDYRNSEITPTLEVPPDLIQSKDNKNLVLPASRVGLESNTGRYVETGNLNIEPRTLPVIDNIKLQGEGDLHWLLIPYPVEKAYPLLRDFWLEQGFEMQLDEPVMGMMKTRWMSSKSGSTSFLSRFLEQLRAAESKHQYTTRLQRSTLNSSSLVFISHRQQELVIKGDYENDSELTHEGWQYSPANPAYEYEMLSRLMLYLGLRDEAVKTELAKFGTFAARASLIKNEEKEITQIAVSEGFEKTWNRLRHQLDRLGVDLLESDRIDNSGTLVIDADQFFAGQQRTNPTSRKQLSLFLEGHPNADNTLIDLIDDEGTIDRSDESEQILQAFVPLLK